ncbi:BTAD domain-containing putative transcriptional regulator [Nonomuraea sp. NPDC050556]|uniref:BTAD domain-containing putative transcriptional regulator n=1 Tax=Nonomuraea sp. NPDC050556 TaxID=3364369 RepID=UPI003796DDB0
MRVGVLGALVVTGDEGPIEVGGTRVRALLALLALENGAPVSQDRLIDALWAEAPPANATNALQTLVKRLRAAIGSGAVTSAQGGYALQADVDAAEFARRVAEHDYDEALALWRGPALTGLTGFGQLANIATRLEDDRLSAIEAQATVRLAGGVAPDQVATLLAEVKEHPMREKLAALAMRALAATGRQAEALTLFERTRHTLAEELGVDPGPDLRAAHLAVLSGVQAAQPQKSQLRAPLTSFIGREDELDQLTTLLRTARMVTIVGPGGAGKTRLATEAALRADTAAWMVELASVADPSDVPGALVDTLGLRDEVQDPAEWLGGRQALLVLDNCEHVIGAAAVLAERLLTSCLGLRILATSREPLGVPGERLAPIPPLEPPPVGVGPERVAASPAVQLLVDRASAVRPGFVLDEGNAGQVGELTRSLDGMPLAIELAAARLRSMTPEQLVQRLGDRFRLLTGGSRTALPRQQTLRAVVEWSWDLLTEEELTLARRLAVFAGGAALESVEAVCGAAALDALGALVDKSLVQADGRYSMLETIRAYAMERLLAADEVEAYRRRHAVHFLDLAERAVPALRTGEQVKWIERFVAERGNFAAAMRWAVDVSDVEIALRLCGALNWYWWMCGYHAEAEDWSRQVLALAGDTPPEGLVRAYAACRFAQGMADVGRVMNEPETMRALMTEMDVLLVDAEREGPTHPMLLVARAVLAAMTQQDDFLAELLERYVASDDPWLVSSALMLRGSWLSRQGRSEGDLERAVDGFRRLGDRWGLTEAVLNLASVRAAKGVHSPELLAEAAELTAPWVAPEESISTLVHMASLRAQGGDLDGATADLAEARSRVTGETNAHTLIQLRTGEADLARRCGDLPGALAGFAEAVEQLTAAKGMIPQLIAMARTSYGRALIAAGEREAAREQLLAAMDTFDAAPDLPVLATVVSGFAIEAQTAGHAERAAELFGGASAIYATDGSFDPDTAEATAACRAELGAARFAAAFARGAALSRQEVYALARSTTGNTR